MIVATTKKRATGDISKVEKLFDEFTLEQRYLGRSESTIRTRVSQLRKLVIDGTDLYDPDSVKEGIYKQNWVNKRKNNGVDAYNALLKIIGKEWTPPKY